jgi:hypothetical protein
MRSNIEATINTYKIPRSTVAKLSGLHLTTVSGWLNCRFEIDSSKIARIENTVKKIAQLVDLAAFPVDLKNIPAVEKAIAVFDRAFKQENLDFDSITEDEKAMLRQMLLNGILGQAKANRVLETVAVPS